MSRWMRSLLALALMPLALHAQAPKVVATETTTTATVDRIERSSRVLTLRSEDNASLTVYVDPSVKAFDDLKTGDKVAIRYAESIVVQVRPGAALSKTRDVTAEAHKAGNPNVIEQLTTVVTVESVNVMGPSIEYRTEDGLRAVRLVRDKRLIEGLRTGDRIEVTLTRERAVSIERAR